MARIYIVRPVRKCMPEQAADIADYVARLEAQGHEVYDPARDTEQEGPDNSTDICWANARAICRAQEIHVWWDPRSEGSIFDLGVAWGLRVARSRGYGLFELPHQRLVLANREYVESLVRREAKQIEKVWLQWERETA